MNNKPTHTLIISIFLTAVFGFSSFVIAGSGSDTHSTGQPGQVIAYTYGNRLLLIELTEEESARLEEDLNAFGESIRAIKKEICLNARELHDELSDGEPDLETAKALQAEISRLKSELDQLRIEHIVQMKKLLPDLSPEASDDASPAAEGSVPMENRNGYIYKI